MRANIAIVAVVVFVCSLVAVACGDGYGDDDDATPTAVIESPALSPTVAVTPTVVAEPTADDGISAVEAIVNAAVANDIETLTSFIRYTPTACASNVQGSGGPPPCRAGEADGTLVDVLPQTTCEGEWRRADELFFDPVATGTVTFVGAFVAPEDFYPPGETVLVFTRLMSGLGELGWELVLDDGAIVGVKFGCGETAAELIEFQGLTERVAVGSELAAASGIESVDLAIAAMLSGDVQALRTMVVFSEIACIAPADGLGAPPFCLDGEPVGTIVDVFPVAHCHGEWVRPDALNLEALAAATEFYAVYRTNDGGWPPGEYALIFVRGPMGDLVRSAIELIVTADGIVGVHTGCAMSPETMVEFQGLTDVLVAPDD